MHYPSFAEYSDALQLDLGHALRDPLLGRGTLRMRGPGHPVAHSGNFALTFEVDVDGRKYAVRCFHKHADALRERYEAIGACLRSIRSPYFVDFEFQRSGITTDIGTYPIVRMDWAPGRTLAAFVADHLYDANALQALRATLRALAAHLREHGIAHGDLQPTNLIARSSTDLRLIDYDGLFVPQLARRTSTELGQRNFQHPERRAHHFDARLDRFSFALIDLALDAICRQPDLWSRTDSGADAFILRAVDFADPINSPAFRLLAAVPELEQRVTHFAACCLSPYEQFPDLEDFLAARNVPGIPIVFSGDTSLSLRDRYLSVHDVVDASNFARCCARVGDQIELVGRIVRVVMGPESPLDPDCLRVEFGAQAQDLVCLKIWPEALAGLKEIPDPMWVGRWLSAVGLVDPVHTAGSGARRRKDVSIAISEQSQLHRLTEAEARHRLRGRRRPTDVASDNIANVTTDRVHTDAVLLPPTDVTADGTSLFSRWRGAMKGVSRGWWWVCAVMVASVAIHAGLAMWTGPNPESRLDSAEQAAARVKKPERRVRPAPQSPVLRLESQQSLKPSSLPLTTAAGPLTIASGTDAGQAHIVQLNGAAVPNLHADVVTLVHRAVYSDRDVIVGFTQCNDAVAQCAHRQPFWLELRAGTAPNLRQMPGTWVSTGAGTVTASDAGVQVKLGVWDGERRSAMFTLVGNIVVSRAPEPRRPLDRADCAKVIQAAEACAFSRDCSSFASSAQRIKPPQWAQLTRLYHESTGLDDVAFRGLCMRSCELGLTPSRSFIRRNVCAGAQPGQWPAIDSTDGLLR